MVRRLAAHFRVKRRLIQNENARLAAGDGAGNLLAYADAQDLSLRCFLRVAGEFRWRVVQSEINPGPGQVA